MPTVDKKSKLILVISDTMTDRSENSVIRMSANTRKGFGNAVKFSNDKPVSLDVERAYLVDLRKTQSSEEYSEEERSRVGFVSKSTFERIVEKPVLEKPKVEEKPMETITMGADPEFLLYDENNTVVPANNIMQKYGKLGCDGAMAEIRPDPATTTDGLIDNINSIFRDKTITERIGNYKWMSGCYYKDDHRDYPLGGHIHVGNIETVKSTQAQSRYVFFAMLNKILDELLSIPLSRLDGKEPGSCRRTSCGFAPGGGYGYFGEWRECQGRFEHRTLSGMWLIHPTVATAVMGVARAVIKEAYVRMRSNGYKLEYVCPLENREVFKPNHNAWKSGFDGWEKIPLLLDMRCTKSSELMNKLLNSSDSGKINATFLREWQEKLRSFSTYKEYEQYIKLLVEILKIPVVEVQRFERQIQKNWIEKSKFITG